MKMQMKASSRRTLLVLLCALVCCAQLVVSQQDNDNDDFDDSGFDDSGYNQPQNHDAEGSNQNPSNYSPADADDIDDDDDVDETHVSLQVAPGADDRHYSPRRDEQSFAGQVEPSPRRFYSQANSVLVPNVDPADSNYNGHQLRYRRSTSDENDVEQARREPKLVRQKRHSKYIGPVYTYVKTDKHAHYKWGVKHKVGKHHGR